ncbi:MAG: glycosyltransferase, partial [Anaerolineae bacterium]|nr:glycosyltransferase [Gemmatimonadaceae bacterium]
MKIGLLSFEYPPETGFGGIGTYTWYQARALAKLGHDVHVLAGATSATPLTLTGHDGVTVHRFRSSGVLMNAFGALGKYRLWWTKNRLENALSMYRALRPLLRKHQFDVLEMPECGAEGALVNHLLDVRTVVRFHSPSRLIMPFYDVPP